jgi:hypothetical protein
VSLVSVKKLSDYAPFDKNVDHSKHSATGDQTNFNPN